MFSGLSFLSFSFILLFFSFFFLLGLFLVNVRLQLLRRNNLAYFFTRNHRSGHSHLTTFSSCSSTFIVTCHSLSYSKLSQPSPKALHPVYKALFFPKNINFPAYNPKTFVFTFLGALERARILPQNLSLFDFFGGHWITTPLHTPACILLGKYWSRKKSTLFLLFSSFVHSSRILFFSLPPFFLTITNQRKRFATLREKGNFVITLRNTRRGECRACLKVTQERGHLSEFVNSKTVWAEFHYPNFTCFSPSLPPSFYLLVFFSLFTFHSLIHFLGSPSVFFSFLLSSLSLTHKHTYRVTS